MQGALGALRVFLGCMRLSELDCRILAFWVREFGWDVRVCSHWRRSFGVAGVLSPGGLYLQDSFRGFGCLGLRARVRQRRHETFPC